MIVYVKILKKSTKKPLLLDLIRELSQVTGHLYIQLFYQEIDCTSKEHVDTEI